MSYAPPYTITDEILNLVSKISVAIGALSAAEGKSPRHLLERIRAEKLKQEMQDVRQELAAEEIVVNEEKVLLENE